MFARQNRALALAVLQAADLAATQLSPRYGEAHLDHLGVPRWLQPVLPVIKVAAVVALVASSRRTIPRSLAGGSLLAYYSAAVSFHLRSGDAPTTMAPAVGCALLAGSLV